ncbi:O-antigen ligase family protein [Rathayibacter sp. VKM Ac-2754]|uniref:O-antigen ligase family protein n=1 Tax=Rathayibacter sp. VKM Ac-2754 TaxID=2609251 RepID=UPI0013599483|nr:O-antigen ligase family protein [Rathayibacter sp. VKM Ac-2754]MWV60591.1 hypothetical protein [Rathayibacter sp. VKM Ac-2754]
MIVLLSVLGVCGLFVLVFHRRPAVWITMGIVAAVAFPLVATRSWFESAGPLGEIHPATWVFAFGFVSTFLAPPSRERLTKGRWVAVAAFVVWAAVVAIAVFQRSGTDSAFTFALLYVLPGTALLAIGAIVARNNPDRIMKVIPVVVALGVAEAALGVAQYASGSAIFFSSYYSTNSWWETDLNRAVGTLDSPLDLAALLTMTMPLANYLKNPAIKYSSLLVLTLGVFVTGSRTGIVMVVVIVVWLLLFNSSNAFIGLILSLCTVLVAVLFLSSSLSSLLLDRFGARGAVSTDARSSALDVGLGLIPRNPFDGRGIGFAYTFSSSELRSSFENGYLATAIDLGLIAALSLILIQVWATFTTRSRGLLARAPGLIALTWGFSYSSFVSSSTFGLLAWSFIAISSLAAFRPSSAQAPSELPAVLESPQRVGRVNGRSYGGR